MFWKAGLKSQRNSAGGWQQQKMGAEHFKRALGSCNLKPAEGWAGGSSKKQMWLQQTRTVPDSHPPGACDGSGREEPEVRGSSPLLGERRAGAEAGELSEDLGKGKNGSSAGVKGWDSHQMRDLTKGWEPAAS